MRDTDFKALQERFPPDEIEWRLQQSGEKNGRIWAICVPYVTNRAIQARLDEVAGPENWKNEFRPGPGGGVMCGISVRVGAEWVTKWDGAENTDVEGVKGGLSAAMKRSAVQWGVGRYLYALDESFATISDGGRFRGKLPEKAGGRSFRWDPPRLPDWAVPAAGQPAPAAAGTAERTQPRDRKRKAEAPQPGAAAARMRSQTATAAAGAADAIARPGELPAASPVVLAPAGRQVAEYADDALEAMVEFVRQVGPQVEDAAEIRIDRRVRNLKEFVRENWPAIKEEPRIARAVVQAIETATGRPFGERAA
ncbi:MAG TPA: Rad52/Rad22 family DNA repair protein [Longimicrobiaceae bacterium]|nr:Rad52/Rad22 family DNA repair protein [Longimicrobiaceae bacterium]